MSLSLAIFLIAHCHLINPFHSPIARSSIDTSSVHKGIYEKTQNLERAKFVEPQYEIEEISKSKPYFVQPLSDPKPVNEGKNIHLECRLEPLGDPTMRVEWFQNGKPITIGSRFRTYHDFGFVALDIIHASTLDSGKKRCCCYPCFQNAFWQKVSAQLFSISPKAFCPKSMENAPDMSEKM